MVRQVFLAFLVFGLVACGDDSVAPGVAILGTWELESVNGGLPIQPQTWRFTETALTIVFTARDCTETATYTLNGGVLTNTITALNGSLCDRGIGDFVRFFGATVTADTLTLKINGFGTLTFVFKRVN